MGRMAHRHRDDVHPYVYSYARTHIEKIATPLRRCALLDALASCEDQVRSRARS